MKVGGLLRSRLSGPHPVEVTAAARGQEIATRATATERRGTSAHASASSLRVASLWRPEPPIMLQRSQRRMAEGIMRRSSSGLDSDQRHVDADEAV